MASKISKNNNPNYSTFVGIVYNENAMFLTPTDPYDVLKIIRSMPSGKNPGIDQISSDILKASAYSIEGFVAHIFNVSIETGDFPTS